MNLPNLPGSRRKTSLSRAAAGRKARRSHRLHIESLEARDVPATVPTVLSVTPATGQAFNSNIVVRFSEDVTGAGTVANYSLFAQDGQAFPFTAAYDGATHQATITPTGTLPAGTYSLYIQGDQIKDTDGDNLRLAQPGQVAVANQTGGRIMVSSVIATGLLAPTPLTSTIGVRQPAVGDVNGDGRLDMVAPTGNQLQVFFGNAAGGFNAAVNVPVGAGNGPISVALGDVDGDGDLDIVTANRTSSTIAVLKNSGTGTFAAPVLIPVGPSPTDIVLADFNGDGALDVAVSHNGVRLTDRGVTVRLNTGAGTFLAPTEYLQGVHAGAIATGDFDRDGTPDLAVTDNLSVGTVRVLHGTGDGSFTETATLSVGANPSDVLVADFNADGFADIATVSGSSTTTRNVSVVLNSAGAGFRTPLHTAIPDLVSPFTGLITPLQSLAVLNGNKDAYPDLIVTTQASLDTSSNNTFVLTGRGDGTFVGGTSNPVVTGFDLSSGNGGEPSYVTMVSDPFRLLSAFQVQSTTVRVNLIRNGDFDSRSLDGSQGSLDGWTVFNQRDPTSGSHGTWSVQSGTTSPLSTSSLNPLAWPSGPTPWPPQANQTPQGFQAMLDEQRLTPLDPFSGGDFNAPDSYAGSHALYQDITIPAGVTAKLSLKLSLQNFGPFGSAGTWSNPGDNPSLDYRTADPNQQVRVDIMKPGSDVLNVTSDVLQTVFITDPSLGTSLTRTITADLSAFAGQTIRLRIASANNQGQLIVGADDVKVEIVGTDVADPVLNSVSLRNPSFVNDPSGAQQSSDPTVIGQVGDNASINNIVKVVFDFGNDGNFSEPDDQAVTTFDANGNFSLTAQDLPPGLYRVPVQVVDQAGRTTGTIMSVVIQGPSQSLWRSIGPGSTDTSNQTNLGIAYQNVSGKITGIAIDRRDPTGNTFYISAPNGGVWRTTDGGNDWESLADNVRDVNGVRVNVPVGALGIGTDGVVYAATGVDDANPTSRSSVGVLRSDDDGQTWKVTGATVFAGAHVAKLGVDPTDSNTVFVAVAYWDDPSKAPAVFRTTDGGKTWDNVLDPADMFDPRTGALGAGAPLASVTDLLVDPFNPGRVIIGLGNIGQQPAAASAGVWKTADGGDTWTKVLGGDRTAFVTHPTTIPDGVGIGRVTLAQGSGRVGDERMVYVLLSQPSGPNPPPFDDRRVGNDMLGLWKSSDNMLNFTKVMIRENTWKGNKTTFEDIDLMTHEGHTVGAMAVDPSNPNVVYVAGAWRVGYGGDPPHHSTIRVDTGDMRDAFYIDPRTGQIPNDGDDIAKFLIGWNPTDGFRQYKNVDSDNNYGWNTNPGPPGEGVYWYDLAEGAINNDLELFGAQPPDQLSPATYDIVPDSQGRLLFATAGGLFRGTPLGFDYDYSSNFDGIMGFTTGIAFPPSPPGMVFNPLNGNLQINDLNAAGVDPTDPNRLYTASEEVGTGVSLNGINSWASSGVAWDGGRFVQLPNAVGLVVASPDPQNPTAPANVYRLWQENRYADAITRIPEISTDGGLTFTHTDLNNNGGIGLADNSPVNPVMVINPTKIFNSSENRYFDELLYGDDRVYVTRTSGNAWDAIGGPLSPGAFVSALAISPSANGWYYAGTTDGKFFIRKGAGGFVERSAGLPDLRINGITVEPNAPNTVFVMLDTPAGGGASVYVTTDGGVTWAPVGGSGLPQGPSYAMAIDPRTNVGDPGQHLYVGTDRGVFVSQDGGATWVPAGKGMPAVPVVDLKFTQSVETLLATTQGRGIFILSTDHVGPSVANAHKTSQPGTLPDTNPNDDPSVDAPFSQFDVQFNEPVVPSTFTAADVVVTGPGGNVISNATLNLQVVEVIDPLATSPRHDTFRIRFDSSKVSASGLYKFTIGPNITDTVGNLMNQDGVLPNGQATDAFTATFLIGGTDLLDFVKDTYAKLLTVPGQAARIPTLAELTGRAVTTMNNAQLAALGTVFKELETSFNNQELRTELVTRLFDFGGVPGPNEIGNLLPAAAYTPQPGEIASLVAGLKNGTKSPESIITYILTKPEYFTAAGGTPATFLDKLYKDLFKGTAVTFSKLPSTTQAAQLTQAATPTGRANLVKSLVGGATVKWDSDGVPATPPVGTYDHDNDPTTPAVPLSFRSQEVNLAYQRLLGRFATAAEITAGKALIAKPLAAGSLQGSEWLLWKIFSTQEYFNQQTQNEGSLPDNGLHTNRSWVDAVLQDQAHRASTGTERDTFSQKVLDRFKTQRAAFVNGIVLGTEYRTIKINEYFSMVHDRVPGDTELTAALNSLKNGVTFPSLIAARFASAEFYTTNAPVFAQQPASTDTWAKAVVKRLFDLATVPASSDPRVAGLKARAGAASTVSSRTTAALWLLNSAGATAGVDYRGLVIGDVFQLLLGRAPTATELTAYKKFLTTHRWEGLITDILGNGTADLDPVTAGVQNTLAREFWEIDN